MAFRESEDDRAKLARGLSRIHDVQGDHQAASVPGSLLTPAGLGDLLQSIKTLVVDNLFGIGDYTFPGLRSDGVDYKRNNRRLDLSPTVHRSTHLFVFARSVSSLGFPIGKSNFSKTIPGVCHARERVSPNIRIGSFLFSRWVLFLEEHHPSPHRYFPAV